MATKARNNSPPQPSRSLARQLSVIIAPRSNNKQGPPQTDSNSQPRSKPTSGQSAIQQGTPSKHTATASSPQTGNSQPSAANPRPGNQPVSKHPTARQSNSPHSGHVHKCKALQIKMCSFKLTKNKARRIHSGSKQVSPLAKRQLSGSNQTCPPHSGNQAAHVALLLTEKGEKANRDPGSKTKQKKRQRTDIHTDRQTYRHIQDSFIYID